MNLRIKELIDQASTVVDIRKEQGWHKSNQTKTLDGELLTQLIIQDVIKVLTDAGWPNAFGKIPGVEEVKEHFDIK
jgi:hypothetical protein